MGGLTTIFSQKVSHKGRDGVIKPTFEEMNGGLASLTAVLTGGPKDICFAFIVDISAHNKE